MATKKLFTLDRYLKECDSEIIEIIDMDSPNQMDLILDRTVFFPTGGGQNCDTGKIGTFDVVDVFKKDNTIHHIIDTSNSDNLPKKSDTLRCRLNWERRFLNMQRHCGEHILSGIIDSEFGGVNRGFHMGKDYMTIDISLEKNPKINFLNLPMLKHAEILANEVVWNNLPVTVRHFKTKKEAEDLPLRKPLTIEHDISIVCVGNTENPSDCVACCGTHPNTAGAVGLIKIYKVEPNKGMFRIYFDAGKNAFENYANIHDTISELCKKYSAKKDNLIEKLQILEEKNKLVKNELFHTKNTIIDIVSKELTNKYKATRNGFPIIAYNSTLTLGKSDIENLSKKLTAPKNALFIIYDTETLELYLISDGNIDCTSFKSDMETYGAKGGGNKNFATFKFQSAKNLKQTLEFLYKHKI